MKRGDNLRGINNPKYNFGIRYTNKYRFIFMPDYPRAIKSGYVAEHIYVFQEYNKCSLLPWGEVHHIDPVREGYCNNMPWNLQGVTKWNHRTLDRTKKSDNWRCSKCGLSTYIKPNGRPMWYYGKNNELLCNKCYTQSRYIKKIRKKKNWDGTICFLCGSDKTTMTHRGNYDWRSLNGDRKKLVCNKCYKREYRKRRKECSLMR